MERGEPTMIEKAIRAEALGKSYGAKPVLDQLDLEVRAGTIFGLLGPNGAGKTTAVRILTTLLTPDSGSAFVLGHDVVREAREVRAVIGLTGQYAAVDDLISATENLYLLGRLLGLRPRPARARAADLLAAFGLADAAGTKVKDYSGGMRRRLDLAASLVGQPAVLFLDEPTTGLDLASRNQLWDMIRDLAADGTTVLLTTQYLEEADQLADQIMVIDHGRTVALGTPVQLKRLAGGQVLEVRPLRPADAVAAVSVLARLAGVDRPATEGDLLTVRVPGEEMVTAAARSLDSAGIPVSHLAVRLPSLDEAFLAITGHHAEAGATALRGNAEARRGSTGAGGGSAGPGGGSAGAGGGSAGAGGGSAGAGGGSAGAGGGSSELEVADR
jgi:oleandomycin transport system ATP-binding protein